MNDSFTGLNVLKICIDGDSRERALWPTVAKPLSHYESFWRTLIVLLTNRILPSIPQGDPKRIRLRSTIPCVYELLAMHNYSLFYYMATAREAIDEDFQRLNSGYPHPERAFFALQASVEHAKNLQLLARNKILLDLGVRCKFPKHPDHLYQTIGSYRNAFTHNPVLGRSISQGREFMPLEKWLPKEHEKPLLCRDIERIPDSDMIDGFQLANQLWQDFSAFLQKQWFSLTEAFVQARQRDKFLADLGLTSLLSISCTPSTNPLTSGARSDASTRAASGTYDFP
jgi:hypothetical protein